MAIYRPIGLQALLEAVSNRMGLDRDSGDWNAQTVGRITGFISERARQAWQEEFWPWGISFIEQRQFAADWDVAETYSTGDRVLSPALAYFEAAAASTGEDPDSDTTGAYWTAVTDLVCLIEHDQAWATQVWDECQDVYIADPRVVRRACPLAWDLDDTGLVVTDARKPVRVWCRLRRPAPTFAVTPEWSAASAYAAGDVVYHADETWLAAATTAVGEEPGVVSQWQQQVIPRALMPFVVHAAYADELGAGDGQHEKGLIERRSAQAILDDLADRTFAGQGEQGRAFVGV